MALSLLASREAAVQRHETTHCNQLAMAKKNYYAVASGKRTGIFDSWDEARPLVERVRGALHKGFAGRETTLMLMTENTFLS